MAKHTLELFNKPSAHPPDVHVAVADLWQSLIAIAAHVGGGTLWCRFDGVEVQLKPPVFTRHSEHEWHASSESIR